MEGEWFNAVRRFRSGQPSSPQPVSSTTHVGLTSYSGTLCSSTSHITISELCIFLLIRFVGSSVVVIATKPIEIGEELNNCYGLELLYRRLQDACPGAVQLIAPTLPTLIADTRPTK